MKPKAELLRVVKSPEGEIAVDESGKARGRGAYVCETGGCAAKLQKSRRFEKSFSAKIPQTVFEEVNKHLIKGESDINA
jgi:predicted RNA-binding protein YlxR (DUF448 family)